MAYQDGWTALADPTRRAIFERLFGSARSTDLAARRASIDNDRSLLDSVRERVTHLKGQLGRRDQALADGCVTLRSRPPPARSVRLNPQLRDVLANQLQRGELIVDGAQERSHAVLERRLQHLDWRAGGQRMPHQQRRRLHVANRVLELPHLTVDELFGCHLASVRPVRRSPQCVGARRTKKAAARSGAGLLTATQM